MVVMNAFEALSGEDDAKVLNDLTRRAEDVLAARSTYQTRLTKNDVHER